MFKLRASFFGHEKFCPECGQKNKGKQISFKSFLAEVFNGFISWDAKFWTTIIPLLTNPGKVSKDFVSGKRQRYSNPFQFYLTVSILFFLIVGLTNTYQEFREFSDGGTQKPPPRMVKADNVKVLDSVAKTAQNNLKTTFQNLDSSERAEVMELIPPQVLDSIVWIKINQ